MLSAWRFSLGIRCRTIAATWAILGLSKEAIVRTMLVPLGGLLAWVLFRLDPWFYPQLKGIRVERPLLIVGHPRSGTTFLHRLLTQAGDFVVFQAWEIVMPSLLGRRLFGPIFERRMETGSGFFPKEVGHEAKLSSVEEEELLFLHTGNTQFMALLTPLALSDWDYAPLVYCDEQPAAVQQYSARFLRECYQRQILKLGKTQVVSKINYSAMRLRSLLKEFPDARIVYVVRSPLETIPSHLSLHHSMFDHMWGIHRLPRHRVTRYFQRRYRYNVEFYRHMEDLIEQGAIPPEQLCVVPYDELRASPLEVIEKIAAFAGLSLSQAAWDRIREQQERQRSFQREHQHLPLETFGVSDKQIVRDLRYVFEKYGFATRETNETVAETSSSKVA
jgi:hypothetical protein